MKRRYAVGRSKHGEHVVRRPAGRVAVDDADYDGLNIGCDYTPDEVEFLKAVDAYKRLHNRPFPTLREFLAVVVSLGYRKVEE